MVLLLASSSLPHLNNDITWKHSYDTDEDDDDDDDDDDDGDDIDMFDG